LDPVGFGVTSDQGSGERSRFRKSIGCDFHPGYQQIMVLDLETREMVEKALPEERAEDPSYNRRPTLLLAHSF
jgi:hypothetical protein